MFALAAPVSLAANVRALSRRPCRSFPRRGAPGRDRAVARRPPRTARPVWRSSMCFRGSNPDHGLARSGGRARARAPATSLALAFPRVEGRRDAAEQVDVSANNLAARGASYRGLPRKRTPTPANAVARRCAAWLRAAQELHERLTGLAHPATIACGAPPPHVGQLQRLGQCYQCYALLYHAMPLQRVAML